jgi:hypothetical protein
MRRLLDSSPALERLHLIHRQADVRLSLRPSLCDSLVSRLSQCLVPAVVNCRSPVVGILLRITTFSIISIRITSAPMLSNVVSCKIQLVASVTALTRVPVGISIRIQVYTMSVVFITPHIFQALAVMTSRLTKFPILRSQRPTSAATEENSGWSSRIIGRRGRGRPPRNVSAGSRSMSVLPTHLDRFLRERCCYIFIHKRRMSENADARCTNEPQNSGEWR